MTRDELIRLEELFDEIRIYSRDSRGVNVLPSDTRVKYFTIYLDGSSHTLYEGEFDSQAIIMIFNDNIRQRAETLKRLTHEFESIKVDFNEKDKHQPSPAEQSGRKD
jgi:hypothetical protein